MATPLVCTPLKFGIIAGGNAGQEIVPPLDDEASHLVQPGWIQVILDASVGTLPGGDPGVPVEAALIKQMHIPNAPGPASEHWSLQGLATTAAPRRATPLIGWTGRLVLFPGERLGARAAGIGNNGKLYVMYTGVTMPIECLARVLGLEAPAVGIVSGASTPPPDFSALVQAAQAAAVALTALSQSTP